MRQYRLYVQKKRKYEVVPVGFSWGALCLGVIWALVNGLALRYIVTVFTPAIPMLLAPYLEEPFRNVVFFFCLVVAYAAHVYFSARAFDYRAKVLSARGFELVADLSGASAEAALESWSKSDKAVKYS